MSDLKKLKQYAGERKHLFSLSMVMSSLSTVMGILPFIFIWLIIRNFLDPNRIAYSSDPTIAYAWWAVGCAVASLILYFIGLSLSHFAAFRVETNMRREAMQKIVNMPLGFFDNNTSGRIRKIVDENVAMTHSFLAHQLPDLAGTILTLVITFALIFIFDWRLGLACLVPILIIVVIMGGMGKKSKEFMKMYMDSLEKMNTEAVEYVRGIPIVKVFQQTIYSFKSFHQTIIDYRNNVTPHTRMWKVPMSIYTVVISGFAFFLVPVAILLIGNTENYTDVILNLFFFILITPFFSTSIMRSINIQMTMQQAQDVTSRLNKFLDVENIAVAENPKKIDTFDVHFKNVSFAYPGAKTNAIDGVTFDIPQGSKVALVGASGSGKTTIARLLPRFWDVSSGEIIVGGIDVKEIDPKDLMQKVSFVFQNTKLFKTTLLENIKYGNPDASLEEVNRAVDLAQCREIIDNLPLGLNTKIGVDGTYLSGGEQQRIVLARAILKNAPIVILDEATAFADPENEHLIQKALRELAKDKTVLMIAHRLTSIVDADNILVMDKGRIVEQGTHAELINKKGIYNDMWNEYQQSVSWTIGKEVRHV